MELQDTEEPHRIAGFNTLELAAGLIILVLGIVVTVESLTYPFGSLRNVGAAIFPMLLGILLSLLGLAVIIEGRLSQAIAPTVPWRALLSICASLASFALLIDRAGAFVAIFALVFLAGLADRTFRPLTLFCVSVALCAFVAALVMGFQGIVNIDLFPGA
ncbi:MULTISPECIES: tripartite tricarboxylate transporter TctB family protein [Roseobacteraceae]|uniref:Tripartite tricarboxylate transporter TctB family protein n=1 Tax=Pseudosulfitobacter pseudonitzschiae TaxID=1402135 RepID=A0A221K7P3_9RHOB|nr:MULTISPECIES: tripartite tricarboxylate transporter TctB family protein [Roseobacteraceae]ASM74996.1 tripartite tricarboxylate transporter TctB family protein [Pseudosulfitobacter pseudonitzschiae]